MNKIYGNRISNCGGAGIKVDGGGDADIQGNTITRTRSGIEVDESFAGTIANNAIDDVKEDAILIKKSNPYDYFGIPPDISINELTNLFKNLDANHIEKHAEIVRESSLAKIDQLTSIAERIINFSKVYGPILIATFGPYLIK